LTAIGAKQILHPMKNFNGEKEKRTTQRHKRFTSDGIFAEMRSKGRRRTWRPTTPGPFVAAQRFTIRWIIDGNWGKTYFASDEKFQWGKRNAQINTIPRQKRFTSDV
jgi:hypothetical protein